MSKVILAVEAGGDLFSAALRIGDETQQESAAAVPHSEHALPLIHKLLSAAGITLAGCDAFAFGAGPGRFSGLRLACGIAQAFAFVAERPGIAVDSLAALAEANYGDTTKHASAALPAHRGYMHLANCHRDSRWRGARPRLFAAAEYTPPTRTRRVCGAGFLLYPEVLQNAPQTILSRTAAHADATAIAKLAAVMFAENETLTAEECRPRYVRNRVAQTIAERAAAAI